MTLSALLCYVLVESHPPPPNDGLVSLELHAPNVLLGVTLCCMYYRYYSYLKKQNFIVAWTDTLVSNRL